VAARLAALGSTALPAQGGRTLRQLFTEFAETVGSSARDASQDEAVRGTMADQADAQRTSVSGVSLDEEMTLLIGQQQAYSAATRIVKVAEDMIQEILQIL
jgi:flagellar hook-associated protein 1 FlgK